MYFSHVRVYENRHPFNLLFVINIGEIRGRPQDVAWNKKTKSFFIRGYSTEIWEIKWEDHLLRKFPCSSEAILRFMSFSDDGNVLIIGQEDNLLHVCHMNGTLIRRISFAKFDEYRIHTTFGQFIYYFAYYDSLWNDRNGTNVIDLRLSEMTDFNVESILDVNRTNECKATSKNTKRFSLFLIRRIPGKDDFDLFNITIELRSSTTKYLTAEYSASDDRLLGEFLSNKGEEYLFFKCNEDSVEKWCFAPLASDNPRAASRREYNGLGPDDPILSRWLILYYYDSDKHQLIAGLSNPYSDDQDQQRIYILSLQ